MHRRVLLLVAMFAAAMFLLWQRDAARGTEHVAPPPTAREAGAAEAAALAEPPSNADRVADPGPGAAIEREPLHQFELVITALDASGLPWPRPARSLRIGPLGTLSAPPGAKGTANGLAVSWAGKQPAMTVAIAQSGGPTPGLRMLTLPAGTTRIAFGCASSAGAHPGATGFGNAVGSGMHAFPGFVLPLRDLADEESLVCVGSDFSFALPVERPASLTGVVYGLDGKPAPRVAVALSVGDQVSHRTITDERGRFTLDKLPAGQRHFRAGGGAEGFAEIDLDLLPSTAHEWHAYLALDAGVRGRIVDDTGARIEGWTIEYEGLDVPWFAMARSAKDGTFHVPVAHGTRGRLLLWCSFEERSLPLAVVTDITVGGPGVTINAPSRANGSGIRVRLPRQFSEAVAWGRSCKFADVAVFQEETGRGAWCTSQPGSETFHLDGVPAGWYRVVATTLTHGVSDLGRVWLDGRSIVELGTPDLPDLAHVRFVLPPKADDAPPAELYLERDDVDLRIEGFALESGREVPLPPGAFRLFWKSADGAVRDRRFDVRTGERATIDVAH